MPSLEPQLTDGGKSRLFRYKEVAMSKYHDDLQHIWHRYQAENGDIPISARDAVAWGVARGLLTLPEIDPIDRLAEDMSTALREEYRKDKYGRRYRVNHAVRVTKHGVQYTFWGVMDHSDRPFMEKAFAQRRKQIVGDCLQLKTDVDVYNDKHSEQEPIQVILDFTTDVEEAEGLGGKAA